jgi:hypothetical protein
MSGLEGLSAEGCGRATDDGPWEWPGATLGHRRRAADGPGLPSGLGTDVLGFSLLDERGSDRGGRAQKPLNT